MDKIAVVAIPGFEEIERLVREALKDLMPGQVPAFAKSVVEAPVKGWCTAKYYDALTGSEFSFYEPPTVVAVAFVREGLTKLVSAPAITIPTVALPRLPEIKVPEITLPAAPKIKVPSITLPDLPDIEVPEPKIDPQPLRNLMGYRYVCGALTQWACDMLNPPLVLWDSAIQQLVATINTVNDGFKKTREAIVGAIDALKAFKDNSESALNNYSANIKTSVDAGLADLKGKTEVVFNTFRGNVETSVNAAIRDYQIKTQSALNKYRFNIESSVNAGLSKFIPVLYDMMGLPVPEADPEEAARLREIGDVNGDGVIDMTDLNLIEAAYGKREGDPDWNPAYDLNHDGVIDTRDFSRASHNYGKTVVPTAQLLSPAQIRNVTRDGFEFYGLSEGMKLSYVAVGRR